MKLWQQSSQWIAEARMWSFNSGEMRKEVQVGDEEEGRSEIEKDKEAKKRKGCSLRLVEKERWGRREGEGWREGVKARDRQADRQTETRKRKGCRFFPAAEIQIRSTTHRSHTVLLKQRCYPPSSLRASACLFLFARRGGGCANNDLIGI